jgi:UDP-N-acetylglucosamine/UDP-N-acetylgalactosamine diphosphorylase
VDIGPEVPAEMISGKGVVIHSGCKIYGAKTVILAGVELGYEAPATIQNCQLGHGVKLKGGFFDESTFLEKATVGSGAQIREGCLFEEEARAAHTVGLKQTILFPYVTLGSLINFCDCLMSGGTNRENHSEVGSGYIHFNYTPNQDKATASLIGDVPRGVMLKEAPIFLGGQGALVGPVRINYGITVAAGTIVRKDLLKEGQILLGHKSVAKSVPFHLGLYSAVKRIIAMNTTYIANLLVLRRWYLDVRSRFFKATPLEVGLWEGALSRTDLAIDERIKRLGQVAGRMARSIELTKKMGSPDRTQGIIQKMEAFARQWPALEALYKEGRSREGASKYRDRFLEALERVIQTEGSDYIRVIKSLSEEAVNSGTLWLQGLVEETERGVREALPVVMGRGR